MNSRQVGVRDLKNGLSAYLRRVADGETIVVTDRGRAIARLVPVTWQAGLVELAQRGAATLPDHTRRRSQRPVPYSSGQPQLSDVVTADRRR